MDDSLNIGLHTKDRYVPLAQASRGTIEQVYFALRMAAAEILCTEEALPILLDDLFVMYDEERLALALQWLSRQKQQVLIFTCQGREEEALKKLQIPFHKIVLEAGK